MSTMTPDELRKELCRLERTRDIEDALDALRSAADAWEAQVDRIAGALADLVMAYAGIRKRLEEAEKKCDADHPIEPEWAELLAAGIAWAETMGDGDGAYYSRRARRLFRAIAALKDTP